MNELPPNPPDETIHSDCPGPASGLPEPGCGLPGRVILVSGPSGAGKSTVVKRLLLESPIPLTPSVSATTRNPREGEIDGRDYYFLSHADFEMKRRNGAFLECMEVYGRGDWYGTLKSVVSAGLNAGNWLILEIDVNGALQVMDQIEDTISFFVHPGSLDELQRRLMARGTDSPEAIKRRLEVAESEMSKRHHYSHEIVNVSLGESVREMCQILTRYQQEMQACSKS